jgi:hypothetical protein
MVGRTKGANQRGQARNKSESNGPGSNFLFGSRAPLHITAVGKLMLGDGSA